MSEAPVRKRKGAFVYFSEKVNILSEFRITSKCDNMKLMNFTFLSFKTFNNYTKYENIKDSYSHY